MEARQANVVRDLFVYITKVASDSRGSLREPTGCFFPTEIFASSTVVFQTGSVGSRSEPRLSGALYRTACQTGVVNYFEYYRRKLIRGKYLQVASM